MNVCVSVHMHSLSNNEYCNCCVCVCVKLTGGVNLLDQASSFCMERHSRCLLELLSRLCSWNHNRTWGKNILQWKMFKTTNLVKVPLSFVLFASVRFLVNTPEGAVHLAPNRRKQIGRDYMNLSNKKRSYSFSSACCNEHESCHYHSLMWKRPFTKLAQKVGPYKILYFLPDFILFSPQIPVSLFCFYRFLFFPSFRFSKSHFLYRKTKTWCSKSTTMLKTTSREHLWGLGKI